MRNCLNTLATFIKKKLRFDDGGGGAGKLTSNVSRSRMWKKVSLVLGPSREQHQDQSRTLQSKSRSISGADAQTSASWNPNTLILPFLNLAPVG